MLSINKVKGYRNMLGLSQKEMAKKLNISINAYRNKENGKVEFRDNEKIIIKEMILPLFPEVTLEEIFFINKVTKSCLKQKALTDDQISKAFHLNN